MWCVSHLLAEPVDQVAMRKVQIMEPIFQYVLLLLLAAAAAAVLHSSSLARNSAVIGCLKLLNMWIGEARPSLLASCATLPLRYLGNAAAFGTVQ
jgi:hypothetical protein